MSLKVTICIFAISLLVSYEEIAKSDILNYQNCFTLSFQDRNECLLEISYKQAVITKDPSILKPMELGFDIHSATFLDSSDYNNAGQVFSYILRPYWKWELSPHSEISADISLQMFNGTGGGSGVLSYGRPGIGYSYGWPVSLHVETRNLLVTRFPIYKVSNIGEDTDPLGTRNIWGFILENSWKWEPSPTHSWSVHGGAMYNTEKTSGVIVFQRPVIGYLSLGHKWQGFNWDFELAARSEQTMVKGRTLFLDKTPIDTDYVSIASNNLILSGQYRFTRTFSLNFQVTKSIIEKGWQEDYLNTQFDDPIFGSNFSIGAGLVWKI